ncbi:MAG: DUF4118 domain-containing protein, partial [Acidobacteria bacterium]|nr:DUF4118 domain-containing protein [Acidobacteriota bacterium]
VNAATVGFAYLLLVLIIASTWGFLEASAASLVATVCFNLFFLPPFGTLTIADPENWIALASFLTASLIAGRLSAKAERRAEEAVERQQDVERLYTFSRSILLIDSSEPFAKELTRYLAEVFQLAAVVLYDRRADQVYRAGPAEFEGMEEQLRDAALQGTTYSDATRNRVITAVRLGSEPIAGLAIQGATMADSMLQGIANLVAIGLERARAQELAHQVEAARQSEQLRTTLIDAMAHEFKTPLTSIKAATTSLLAEPDQPLAVRTEILSIADEEANHLKQLIDDAVDLARLDTARIEVRLEAADLGEIARDVLASIRPECADRGVEIVETGAPARLLVDRRLIQLALKQLLDNALKYSPPGTPVIIRLTGGAERILVELTDRGGGIPPAEQKRIFERFYRSPSVKHQVPGSGLGLSIVHSIVGAHNGELTVSSTPGETTFRFSIAVDNPRGEE